jgi:hypothetical protein
VYTFDVGLILGFNDPTMLPGFIEMYIKEDLGTVIEKG